MVDLDKMDRSRFREFLHNAFDMTDDILLDRIFKYFDSDNDGYIGREEWIMGLSVFLKGYSMIIMSSIIIYVSCYFFKKCFFKTTNKKLFVSLLELFSNKKL